MMYIHHVKRTQIYLSEREDRLLAQEARRTGKSRAALIREAIVRVFDSDERETRKTLAALHDAFGAWKDLPDSEFQRLERLRDWSDRQKEMGLPGDAGA